MQVTTGSQCRKMKSGVGLVEAFRMKMNGWMHGWTYKREIEINLSILGL